MLGKERSGQSLVEFALILPILLLIVLGIAETALVIQGYMAVQHAAREAARFATTYQPPQGVCLDSDGDGVYEDGINDDQDLGDPDDQAPWPYCPVDGDADVNETDAEYFERRIELIRRRAQQAAAGLRINQAHLGDTPNDFELYEDEPGFFGILVWGFPSFQVDCNDPDLRNKKWDASDDPPGCLEHPGLEGLPVRILVKHNVEVLDPLYAMIIERVPVRAETQMINEGIQVGFGDVPPPHFETEPDLKEPTLVPTEVPTQEPTPDATQEPVSSYTILLTPGSATNVLPDDVQHAFVATVRDNVSQPVAGAPVSFSIPDTDVGGFNASGTDKYAEGTTNAQGQVSIDVYSNYTGTATIRAWIDDDGDDAWAGDSSEPSDTATKTWDSEGAPYITASDYEVFAEDTIDVDVLDHTSDTDYDLLWCPVSGESIYDTMLITTDSSGNETIWDYEVPAASDGTYRLETHDAGGGCGAADLVARSTEIDVKVARPDLSISVVEPITVCPETEFRVSAVIENHTPGSTDERFDVDFYVDKGSPEGGILPKQWIDGIGPHETVTVTTVAWVGSAGVHTIEAQVDRSDYVEEEPDWPNWHLISFSTQGFEEAKSADFDGGAEGFTYVDDAFRGTNEPYYADGQHISSGGYQGGALQVEVGAIHGGGNDIDHMSGGWQWDFDLDAEKSLVVSFRYNLIQSSGYESNEYSQVLFGVDGALYGDACSDVNCVAEITGNGNGGDERSTGWQMAEIRVGPLTAGDHTLTIGGYNRRKTLADEYTTVLIDDLEVQEDACGEGGDGAPWGQGPCKPPGSRECESLIEKGGFEGNTSSVYEHWHAGGLNAYQRQSFYFYEGTVSMRLHASLGSYPACPSLSPYLYQVTTIPDLTGGCTDTMETTLVVEGQRLIAGSLAPCSVRDTVDADDALYVELLNVPGNPYHLITTGDSSTVAVPAPDAYAEAPLKIVPGSVDGIVRMEGLCSSPGTDLLDSPAAVSGAPIGHAVSTTARAKRNLSEAKLRARSLAYPLTGDEGRARKGLLASVSVAPAPRFTAQSQVIHTASFESGLDGWMATDGDAVAGRNCFYSAADGNCYARGKDWKSASPDPTLSRGISTVGFCNIQISYWRADRRCEEGVGGDRFVAEWSSDGGTTWVTLQNAGPVDWNWTQESFDLPEAAANNPDFIVRFTFDGNSDDPYMAVDNILVTGAVQSVDFSRASYSVGEGDGSVEIPVTLNDAINDTVTVDYTTSADTATPGEDYVETSGTLTFDPNETEKSFFIDITSDGVYEGHETVTLTLSSPTGASLGPNSPAVLTIFDDEPVPVDFGSIDYRVNEGAGTAAIDVVLSSTSYQTATVDYSTAPGTATAGEDYTSTVGTLIFPPSTALQTFEVPIIDDDTFFESDETIDLALSSPVNATVGGGSATLTIEENDLPEVDFSASEYSVSEEAGEAVITAMLNTSLTETVTVNYATQDGTAIAPDDYTDVSGQLTFSPGTSVLTFTVPISDDVAYEGDEELTLVLSDAAYAGIGPNNPAVLMILDNEPFAPEEWKHFSVNFSNDFDVASRIGEDIGIRFYAEHDADPYGTWFYLDDVDCEVCTEWPAPSQDPDMATIWGTLRVEGVREGGVDIWAYNQTGDTTYQAISLDGGDDLFPRGTYHFYNVSPGTYTIYSELWDGGLLLWDTETVTVDAGDERQVDLDLNW